MNPNIAVVFNIVSAVLAAVIPVLSSVPMPVWVLPVALAVNAGLHAIPAPTGGK